MADNAVRFIEAFNLDQASPESVYHAKRCLLDLIGVAAAGSTTPLSGIIRDHAVANFASADQSAGLLFDDRTASPVGAALANGMTIDAFDAHDGHPSTKGHAGCGALAGLLAFADERMSGAEFLADLIVGYEIAIRAGLSLHATVSDYHTSGAWTALGVAAIGARRLGLGAGQVREALGIAEYHGPRSQMMRCIDHPTMLKDGSGWGAMAGVSAAFLARNGFTGAPAITVEGKDIEAFWSDLGSRWTITEQYLKPFPVCRWAQPPMEAVRQLAAENSFAATEIGRVVVRTFHEAYRLATAEPTNTEQAQYSLPFPLAVFSTRQSLGPGDIAGDALSDPEILRLSKSVVLVDDAAFSAKFPDERWAQVTLELKDGRKLISEPVVAHGNAENPLSDDEISQKFNSLMAASGLGRVAGALEREVAQLENAPTAGKLLSLLRALPVPDELQGAAE